MANKCITVAVAGSKGKMGREVVKLAIQDKEFELIETLDRNDNLDKLLDKNIDVMVDFTIPNASFENVTFAIKNNINVVVGTSGWSNHKIKNLKNILKNNKNIGVLIAPNFSIGAILSNYFSSIAAQYFNSVEIVELHHKSKLDSPSSTAIHSANVLNKAIMRKETKNSTNISYLKSRNNDNNSYSNLARGMSVNGIRIHSMRLDGLIAKQNVLFGNPGEQMTIKHTCSDRKSFMKGVKIGIKSVINKPGLALGLETYLNLTF